MSRRPFLRHCATLSLLLLIGLPRTVAASDCKAYAFSRWIDVEAGTITQCLSGVNREIQLYDAQGFKFGLWRQTMLSADAAYYYSSEDSGQSWVVVGRKTELGEPPREPAALAQTGAQTRAASTAPAAATARATMPAAAADRSQDPALLDNSAFFVVEGEAPPSSIAAAALGSAAAPEQNPVSSAAPVAAADGEAQHDCNLRGGDDWTIHKRQTLAQCIALLDALPPGHDGSGYSYGYWRGTYLAANARELLQSSDSRNWTHIRARTPR